MAEWKHVIDISDSFYKYSTGKVTVREAADDLIEKLRRSPYVHDLVGMIWNLTDCDDAEEFDELLEELFDFGDDNHKLFIQTF